MSFEAPIELRKILRRTLTGLGGKVPRRSIFAAVYALHREAHGLGLTEPCRSLDIFQDVELAPYPELAALESPMLSLMWRDHDCLGWTFQCLNDPGREKLDKRMVDGGKIEPHEICCKTQIFTERYMVEWILQNSLGFTWLCMCRKHGWTPDAEPTLAALETRRIEWRERMDVGAVAPDELMPIENALEDRWKYFVPQPFPDDAIKKAPESVHKLKILDPAVGPGAFILAAYDHVVCFLLEQWKHEIADHAPLVNEFGDSFLLHLPNLANAALYGVDLDPAVLPLLRAMLYAKIERTHRMLGNDLASCPPVSFSNIVAARPLPGTLPEVKDLQRKHPDLPLLDFWSDTHKHVPVVGSLYKSEVWPDRDSMLDLFADRFRIDNESQQRRLAALRDLLDRTTAKHSIAWGGNRRGLAEEIAEIHVAIGSLTKS